MKKILTIMTISIIVLVGCDTSENITTKKEKIKTSTDYYKDEIKKMTDKDIYKMIVEDYDNDGEKEAFILVNKEAGAWPDKRTNRVPRRRGAYERAESRARRHNPDGRGFRDRRAPGDRRRSAPGPT